MLSSPDRHPALIVGLGGTGVRTLRYIRWLAEVERNDPTLTEMWHARRLQILAIDTDIRANDEKEEIDRQVIPEIAGRVGTATAARRLPKVDEIVLIDSKKIANAWKVIREKRRDGNGQEASARPSPESPNRDQSEAETFAEDRADRENEYHPSIMKWFPEYQGGKDDFLVHGHARHGGAAQWRPFGRLGLFLHIKQTYKLLDELYRRVRNATQDGSPVLVYVVCSLAGGTGSGMFWDIAFLLRTIDPDCVINGVFLLPEVFAGVDRGGRIEANAYAALKEIATIKNWRHDLRYTVHYPVDELGLPYVGNANTESAFDKIYLYRSFPPLGSSSEILDVYGSTIKMTCFRMAENILTQLRVDIRNKLDEAGNNEKGDTNSRRGEISRAYCFSTSMSTVLSLYDSSDVSQTLLSMQLDALRTTLRFRHTTPGFFFDLKDAVGALVERRALSAPGNQNPSPAEARRTARSRPNGLYARLRQESSGDTSRHHLWEALVDRVSAQEGGVFQHWLDEQVSKPPTEPGWVVATLAAVDALRTSFKSPLKGKSVTDKNRIARDLLFETLPENLMQGLVGALNQHARQETEARDVKVRQPLPPALIGTVVDLFEQDFAERWQVFLEALSHIGELVKSNRLVLTPKARSTLRMTKEYLEALQYRIGFVTDEELAGAGISLPVPAILAQMRVQLELINPELLPNYLELLSWTRRYGGLSVEQFFMTFLESLSNAVRTLARRPDLRGDWQRACEALAAQRSGEAIARIDTILENDKWNDDQYEARVKQIDAFLTNRCGDPTISATARERFEDILAPLPETLNEIVTKLDDWTQRNIAGTILRSIYETGIQRYNEVYSEFNPNVAISERWRDLLEALHRSLSLSATTFHRRIQTSEPTGTRISEALQTLFRKHVLPADGCDVESRDLLFSGEAFEGYMRKVDTVITGFLSFWVEQDRFVLARLGGRDGLISYLKKCHSNVFIDSRIQNRVTKVNLVISRPPRAGSVLVKRGQQDSVELEQAFLTAARAAINNDPVYCDSTSSVPVVYYEQLFRSGKEIAGIDRYRQRYYMVDEEVRPYLHFHRDMYQLEDIFADPSSSDRKSATDDPQGTRTAMPDEEEIQQAAE